MRRRNWKILSGRSLMVPLLLAALGSPAAGQDDRAAQERSERLAKHALLFKVLYGSPTLENTPPNVSGEIDLTSRAMLDYVVVGGPRSSQKIFKDIANGADVIVLGVAERQESALTAQRTSVFSEWDVRVTRIFKNTSSIPSHLGDVITIVRLGGRLVVNGRVVLARDRHLPDWAPAHAYLLYLKSLPDTRSFQPVEKGFEMTPDGPKCLVDLDFSPPQRTKFCASLSSRGFFKAVERSVVP